MGISEITLSTYSEDYIDNLKDYMLPPEQYEFTSYPMEVLNIQEQDQFPVLILQVRTAVGFFCLNRGRRVIEVTTNQKALLLTSFSINYKYQKRGYAKKALSAISTFIKEHYAEIDEVVLVVNMRNIPAQALYKSCGFKDLGERRMGKRGEQMVLHLDI